MINNDRQEDLMKVFDKTWTANHNDVSKRGREKERKFMDKMFNTDRTGNNTRLSFTPKQMVERLHNHMNNAFYGKRKNNIDNIIKKWK